MHELTIEQMRLVQLEMMDSIHSYCKAENIRYSLAGGSLLGAVKYSGYVPFDDDIDIMMPRPDYERFINSYESVKDYVMDLSQSDSCREMFSKVCRRGTRLSDPLLGRTTFPIFIDVCPVDGVPSDCPEYLRILRRKLNLVPKICAYYKEVPGNKSIWFLKYVVKRILVGYPHNEKTLKQSITDFLSEYRFEDCPKAGEMLVFRTEEDVYPIEIFTNYREYEFEGRKYCGICDYDTYLTSKYAWLGDYMNLPPLSQAMHNYKILSED